MADTLLSARRRAALPVGSTHRAPTWILALACLLPWLPSCNQLEGSGELRGTLELPECDGVSGDFSMDLDFFALEQFNPERLLLRLQHGGRGMEVNEGLMLTVYDRSEVLRRRGEALPVTPMDLARQGANDYLQCDVPVAQRPDFCPLLRAELHLPDRCPPSATMPNLEGQAVFLRIGTDSGERVAGTLDLQATDARSGDSRGQLSGEFDFVVMQGHPYQRFPR